MGSKYLETFNIILLHSITKRQYTCSKLTE